MKPRRIVIGNNGGTLETEWKEQGRVDCVQKAGKVLEGEVVRIAVKDECRTKELGLARCVHFAPRNDWDARAGRGRYVYERLEEGGAE